MHTKTTKIILITMAVVGIFILALPVIIHKFVRIDAYRDTILTALKTSLNRPITYKSGEFSAFLGASFTFNGIDIKERDGANTFATAESITFKLALLPLLEKKIVLKKVVIKKPNIVLHRDKTGRFSVADLLEGERKIALQLKGIQIKEGTLTIIDQGVSPAVTTTIDQADLSVSRLTRGKNCDVELTGRISNGRTRGEFAIKGSADLAAADQPFADTVADLKVSLTNIDATNFWPYYSSFVPFNRIDGLLTLETSIKGKISNFHGKGKLGIKRLRFDYPAVFHAVLTPQEVDADYEIDVAPSKVDVKSLTLTVDGLRVKGSCKIADIKSGDPIIIAQANTSTFNLGKFRQYIPYGIIVKGTADFIEQHVLGGTYRLIEGRLNGRASQIAHMEKGTNYKVLYINGTVEEGLLSFGKTVPTFNGIKGRLQLQEKDFILSGMSGNFGSSPFTLEGRIQDYCMNVPSQYPFTMDMAPNRPEISWLVGQDVKLQFTGGSQLKMAGAGTYDNYSLSGNWNLAPATYAVSDILAKPAGVPSSLSFKTTISEKGAKVPEVRYSLSNFALAATADYRAGAKPHTTISLRSNLFPIADIRRFSPVLQKHDALGKAQVTVTGSGNINEPAKMNWNGSILVEGGSYSVNRQIKRITDINGTFAFGSGQVETSLLSGKIGTSTFYTKGSITTGADPVVTVSFSLPIVDPVDFGFVRSKESVLVTNVQGNVQYLRDTLSIRSLSGKAGSTPLKVRGKITNLKHPEIEAAISSTNLELNDVFALLSLERELKQTDKQQLRLKATMEADAGKIGKTSFRDLSATVSYEDGILYLQPVALAFAGGKLTGKGRFDVGTGGMERYQVSFDLQKASADQLLRAFEVQKELLKGTISLQGDLTAKGNNAAEMKQSLLGWVKLKADEGTLRQFSVLSKVFSILNVSQLLKFQLPDMVSDGMPYNHITGTVSFRDGVASSKDLFVDSDALNISVVGKANIPKEELDLTIGVQPLQTIDKVVNRIPIVGWILTGKDKSMLTSYFEAKGRWDDPRVSAIPVKAMGKGVFDIFKRVFQLPEKLITDTGEVIIGK